jgi:hypothetical protein
MPIQVLTPSQLREVTKTSPEQVRSDRFRNLAVAAFGAADWVLPRRPLAVDAVAVALRDDLAKVLPRKTASVIVRGFFDLWIEAVARAEHGGESIIFLVAQLVSGPDEWRCAIGPAAKLSEHIAQLPPWKVCVTADVGEIMRGIRERASNKGIDLSGGSFFLPLDHPLTQEWISEFRAARQKAGFEPKPVRISAEMRKQIEVLTCEPNVVRH